MKLSGRGQKRLAMVSLVVAFAVDASMAADGSGTDNSALLRGTYGTGCLVELLCQDAPAAPRSVMFSSAPAIVLDTAPDTASSECLTLAAAGLEGPECGALARSEVLAAERPNPEEASPDEAGGTSFDWSVALRGSVATTRNGTVYEVIAVPTASAILHSGRGDTTFSVSAELVQGARRAPRVSAADFSIASDYALDPDGRLEGGANIALSQDSADGVAVASTIASMPVVAQGQVSGGFYRTFGKFEAGLTLNASREVYSDTELTGGGWSSNTYRNRTGFGAGVSGAYAITPLLSVFSELSADRSQFDAVSPSLGVLEDAWTFEARTGLRGNWGETASGEIWGGYFTRQFDAGVISAVQGWSYGGTFTYATPQGLNLTAEAATDVSAAGNVSGASARLGRSASLSATYAVNDWLGARGSAGLYGAQYPGTTEYEAGYSLGVGLDWQSARQTAFSLDYAFGYDETPSSNQHTHRITMGATISR